jgi:T5SS/PEP-CTERM-associated repeat protein/autotransporter-associated beta strand protein
MYMLRSSVITLTMLALWCCSVRVFGEQLLWYPNQTMNPPINSSQASWNDASNWTIYSDFTQVPMVPDIGPAPTATDDVIFSGSDLLMQPPSQSRYSATYVYLGDFIKQTASGNVPYRADPSGTTTVNSVTVNSGAFTFDFGTNVPPGNGTLPGNTSGLTVSADAGFEVGTTLFNGSGITTLTITGPGQLATTDAQIGIGVGVNGTLTLTGSQTVWVDSAGTYGGMTIGNSFSGDSSAGTGTLTVTGGATLNANGGLTVGNTGTGTLNVTGGTVSAANVVVGAGSGSMGTAAVSGNSQVSCAGVLLVGYDGTGSLSVSGTSASLTIGGNVLVGYNSDGNGIVTIQQGAGMKVTGGLVVGNSGTGTLTVSGASLSASGNALVGNNSGAMGTLTVEQGGQMTVETGSSAGTITVLLGAASGATGQMTVSGSGSLLNTTAVGQGPGSATVSVQDNGSITANVFEIGGAAGSIGQATVTGANSSVVVTLGNPMIANGFLGIGQFGQGSLAINAGATASAPFVLVGEHPGGVGQITVSDTGSSLQASQTLSVGTGYVPSQGLDVGPAGGMGTLQVSAGGSVIVGQQLATGDAGTVSLEGTGVMLVGSGALPTAPSTLLIASGGSISGTGTIAANVVFASSSDSTFNGAIVDDLIGGSSYSLTLTGSAGTLTLGGTSTYSGGTYIGAGLLNINADGALGAMPTGPSINITFNGAAPGGTLQFATGYAGGTLSATRGIAVTTGSAGTVDTNGNNIIWDGLLSNSGSFTKVGAGLLEIGGLALASNTTLAANAGTLRLNVASASTISTGVTVTVGDGATLELAGSVSALSGGTNRVNIANNSAAPGILVSGTHQQVGNIDGSGTTQVNVGSDLTANHIIQSALVIGGTAGTHGLVTIDASDASGNPLATSSGFALASSLEPSEPFASGSLSSLNWLASSGSSTSGLTLGAGTFGGSNLGGSSVVPEPAALLLALLGLVSLGCLSRRQRK